MLKRFTTLIIAGAFILMACEQNMPNQAADRPDYLLDVATTDSKISVYPMFGSYELKYAGQGYNGGKLKLQDGSSFIMENNSITPPVDVLWGENFTITWLLEKVNGELIFTFGPHGTKFSPPATVWLDFSALGTDNVSLWYIKDDGSRVQQKPIDVQGNKLLIYIDHFSRYAIGTEY